ncbi:MULTISPECIES: nicotinate-nucleotide adenylyltransferase [Peptoniphilus]|uniref:nicotinate-nucleotide adenylyltransferase n=1 Tax=Peptoniphilus TaxID=162289 RepID=UPI00028A295C|nr:MULTISPECIES: nicotinate-nucleotide adenylyltransferase [Peptoniphilus]MBS6610949.1 nicotinate-nucleotide adenylyltransferase [Peptoniphilus harei]MDU5275025.1 nicotinate-nucleotide adenylyltransferase [Peptoniphilus lacydonensis]MDU5377301.1 nicotinate-nucleotide adenylyltransferase [Peptoniphilus lacydonensis]MDU5437594.1 nicotinate-nucleotide adenylyltransferase [Peptoniphilus lacydonensis]MDU5594774.1 nicotinate-nucleotide adenylyltransferase [Peptoniphilus rhinitidis]
MEKYGIFGGTFNPIHFGHLMICEYLKEELGLDKVIFIPTGNPPHKSLDVSAIDRYNMVKLAISSNPDFEISDIETNRVNLSYTVDTIIELKKIYENQKLFFLIGLDTLFQLKTWRKIEELSREIEFVVALRPKYIDIDEINRELKFLRENYGTIVEIIHTPLYEISSTELRTRIRDEKSVRYLIPNNVVNYIKESGFYKVEQ